jgi:hypothetical protein
MDNLVKQKNLLYKKIKLKNAEYNKEIQNIHNDIELLNDKIYNLCEHKWVHDRPSIYDRMETYCTKCGLYIRST